MRNVVSWEELLKSSLSEEKEEISVKILPFETFVKEDLEHPELSPVQLQEALNLLGPGAIEGNAEKLFDVSLRPKEAVWLWGKGSGKGVVSSLVVVYVSYALHFLLPNPHAFFGIAKEDALSIVTVATTGEQSSKLHDRIKNRIKSSKFFSKYPQLEDGKVINRKIADMSLPPIKLSNPIKFQAINLEILSVTSKNESWEGLTIIAFIMDEASGFVTEKGLMNAHSIYGTLTTSTRELPYIGLITSFPRLDEEHDFTYKKYKEIKDYNEKFLKKGNVPDSISSHYYTWQVKPKRFFSSRTFKIYVKEYDLEVEVPMDYKPKFTTDFRNSVAKYLALPVGYGTKRWMDLLSQVDDSLFIDESIVVPFTTTNKFVKNNLRDVIFLQKELKITRLNTNSDVEYFMGVDLGESDCSSAIALGHGEIRNGEPVLVVDGIIEWIPVKQDKIMVDINNVYLVILTLAKYFNIRKVKSDKWNTAGIRNIIREWDDSPVGLQEYSLMKDLLYSAPSRLVLPPQKESYRFLSQCRSLQEPRGNSKPRVGASSKGDHQDVTDAVAGLVFWYSKIFKISSISSDKVITEMANRGLALGTIGSREYVGMRYNEILNTPLSSISLVPQGKGLGMGVVGGRGVFSPGKPRINPNTILQRFEK